MLTCADVCSSDAKEMCYADSECERKEPQLQHVQQPHTLQQPQPQQKEHTQVY